MGQEGSHVKIDPKDLKDLRKRTEFGDKEIKTWYKDFTSGCEDGILDKPGLMSMFSELFPDGDAGLFTDNVFRTYDTNGDGKLDFKEFMVGISVTSRGSHESKLQWAFELYDQDGNGYICRKEAIAIIKAVEKMRGKLEATPEDMVDKMFGIFDVNEDGKLSKKEFVEGCEKDPTFENILEW